MAITLRQIRYFVATAEVGQISQAAIHLHISLPHRVTINSSVRHSCKLNPPWL